jgi:branched-chain amino acid transport system ATP-binding protein
MLNVENVTCRYGSVTALRDATMTVKEGEMVCLLGSNGAGKSTLISAIAGVLPPVEGTIEFAGERIDGRTPNDIAHLGVAVVPEGHRVFPAQSVDDNLVLGAYVHRRDKDRVRELLDQVREIFPVLAEKRALNAGLLSGGQQQMLAIGQALMANPRLLVLDEPSQGLAPSIVETVLEVIERLRRTGLTILLVEQKAKQALGLSDRGYLLQTGRIVASGPAHELRDNPIVREAYLGLAAS